MLGRLRMRYGVMRTVLGSRRTMDRTKSPKKSDDETKPEARKNHRDAAGRRERVLWSGFELPKNVYVRTEWLESSKTRGHFLQERTEKEGGKQRVVTE